MSDKIKVAMSFGPGEVPEYTTMSAIPRVGDTMRVNRSDGPYLYAVQEVVWDDGRRGLADPEVTLFLGKKARR